jgi:hypothetical protein
MTSVRARNKVFLEVSRCPKTFTVSSTCKDAKILREFDDEGLIRITEIDGSPYHAPQWRIERQWPR